MFKTLGTMAAFVLLTGASLVGLNMDSTASAWMVKHQESAYCNEENRISFDWSFTSQEPNDDKFTIDLTVTEIHSGQKTEKTVKPGETVSGSFDTDYTRVGSWRMRYEMEWTNGMAGYHQVGDIEPGLECEQPPKTIEVCRDGKVITINVNDRKDSDTDAPCPVVEKIKVCRDGEVITINKDDRKSTDTEAPCPVPEEEFQVCRDGEEIMVTESEFLSTDVKGECPEEPEEPQVLGETTELPKTGAASLISVFGATSLASAAYGYIKSRK